MNKHLSSIAIALLIILLAASTSCNHSASKQTGSDSTYVLNGFLAGLDSGWVYLVHRESEDHRVDSIRADNGHFIFTGREPAPEHCLLEVAGSEGQPMRIDFFLQNGDVEITGKIDSFYNLKIAGSHEDSVYRQFFAIMSPLGAKMQHAIQAYQMARVGADYNDTRMDSAKDAVLAIDQEQREAIKDYAIGHPAAYVSALELYLHYNVNPDPHALDSAYSALDPAVRNSFYGKRVGEILAMAMKTAIGNVAPDFTLPDTHGRPVALSSFKGKYTLLDFWASWCAPCRAENPTVVKAYHKFHPRGLAILGISLDNNAASWKTAIKKDKLNWTQVSDLKGWESSVLDPYGVKSIPMNFLLDKNGKIVGKDMRGKTLMEKLEEVVR